MLPLSEARAARFMKGCYENTLVSFHPKKVIALFVQKKKPVSCQGHLTTNLRSGRILASLSYSLTWVARLIAGYLTTGKIFSPVLVIKELWTFLKLAVAAHFS